MPPIELVQAFCTSLGVGLLIGLERERSVQAAAGLRTFALTALLGTACAMLAQEADAPWLLVMPLLILALMMIIAHGTPREPGQDPGTTTTVALLLCFVYGATLWHGHTLVVVALALVTTALLHYRDALHGATRGLADHDVRAILQFAAITFVILPVLPDRGYGPYEALNPYSIWLMVVLITGVGLAGYVALRLAGPGRAPPLLGIMGGLASSTATTMVFSRTAKADRQAEAVALLVILVANLVVLVRLVVLGGAIAPKLVPALAIVLGTGLVAGLWIPLAAWRRLASGETRAELEVGNPIELKAALTFAAIYAVVRLASAWLEATVGTSALYVAAPVFGLTDVDAISLSTFQLFDSGALQAREAATVVAIAYASNLAFKLVLAAGIAGWAFGRRLAAGFAAVLAGLCAGVAAVWLVLPA